MNKPRKKWLIKITVWLVAEILLSFLGLDDMADYSEFIFERNVSMSSEFGVISSELLGIGLNLI